MTMWTADWMLFYVLVLFFGYIGIFAFLDRVNRRKNNQSRADKADHQQELARKTGRSTN